MQALGRYNAFASFDEIPGIRSRQVRRLLLQLVQVPRQAGVLGRCQQSRGGLPLAHTQWRSEEQDRFRVF